MSINNRTFVQNTLQLCLENDDYTINLLKILSSRQQNN